MASKPVIQTQPAVTAPVQPAEVPAPAPKIIPITKMNLDQVDAALANCQGTLREQSEIITTELARGGLSIPASKLKALRQINSQKAKLMMRRFALLLQSNDPKIKELIDQILTISPATA